MIFSADRKLVGGEANETAIHLYGDGSLKGIWYCYQGEWLPRIEVNVIGKYVIGSGEPIRRDKEDL